MRAFEHGTTYRHDGAYLRAAHGDEARRQVTDWGMSLVMRVLVWGHYHSSRAILADWPDEVLWLPTSRGVEAALRRAERSRYSTARAAR